MTDYERIFDSESEHWHNDNQFNLLFLRTQQNYWNDVLQSRGHVFLNEVLGALGFPHTPVGAVVGWTLSGAGDGGIEFNAEEFPSTSRVKLDFNVDGFILDKLGTKAVR